MHPVKLTYDYYIGKYEVTFNEYDIYCENTGKSNPDDRGWGREKRPVILVSWYEAMRYCNWLSEKEEFAKAYDGNGNLLDRNGRKTKNITQVEGYRLPTEAEWEYAAMGGQKSGKNYKYTGSDNPDDIAWHRDNSEGKTHEVGQKAPNELGLYDMCGNVSEFCQDWYDKNYYMESIETNFYDMIGNISEFRKDWYDENYYNKCLRVNPVNLERHSNQVHSHGPDGPNYDGYDESDSYRVVRSLNFGYHPYNYWVSTRSFWQPFYDYNAYNCYRGFRVARTQI